MLIVGGAVLFFADKLTGGSGIAGLAAATTAGNAATVPMLVAAANPAYKPAAGPATVLVSASVIVTSIGCARSWSPGTLSVAARKQTGRTGGQRSHEHQAAIRWTIIADDLTGAADAAAAYGPTHSSSVILDVDAPWPDAQILSINTESRYLARRRGEPPWCATAADGRLGRGPPGLQED